MAGCNQPRLQFISGHKRHLNIGDQACRVRDALSSSSVSPRINALNMLGVGRDGRMERLIAALASPSTPGAI